MLRPWLGLQLTRGLGHPDTAVSGIPGTLPEPSRSFWKQQATRSPQTGGEIATINNLSVQWRQREPARSRAPHPVGDTALAHTSGLAPPNQRLQANPSITAAAREEGREPRDKAEIKQTGGRGTETSLKEKEG